ncbi:MAG: glycosyltransferase family 39 protein [Acidobacteriota bacterium]
MSDQSSALGGRVLRAPARAIAILALAVHLLFLALLPASVRGNESADFQHFYRPMAERLLDGRGLVDESGRAAVRYPPGFPAFLALGLGAGRTLGIPDSLALRGLAALCVAAIAGLLTALAVRWTDCRRTGLLAGLAWSLYPPFLWLAKQPNSELPFLVLLLAAFLLWTSALEGGGPGRATLAGALLGTAALLRPVALLLAPTFALAGLAWLRPRESGRRLSGRRLAALSAAVIAAQALTLLPWEAWVYARNGTLIPVSSGGRLSLLDGLTLGAQPGEPAPDLSPRVLALTRDIEANRRQIQGVSDAARFLLDRAGDDPRPVLELLAKKAARAWFATETTRFESWLLALQAPVLCLALVGLWRDRRRPESWLIAAFVLYSWAMTVLVLSILRYMVPAMALLMIPLARALVAGLERFTPSIRGASA